MKVAILTSVCGNIENLHVPTVVHGNADYYAFVDCKDPSNTVWNQLNPYHFSNDLKYANRRNAKIYKILPELFVPGYDIYFWVDASHDVVSDPLYIVETHLKEADYGLFSHSQRSCIYEEATLLKKLNYDHPNLIDSEVEFFRSLGYPENNGLYELSTFVKRNSHTATTASLKWWEYICRYASRDQISLPVVLWEYGITPSILPGFSNGFNKRGTIGNNDLMPQTRPHSSSGG